MKRLLLATLLAVSLVSCSTNKTIVTPLLEKWTIVHATYYKKEGNTWCELSKDKSKEKQSRLLPGRYKKGQVVIFANNQHQHKR